MKKDKKQNKTNWSKAKFKQNKTAKSKQKQSSWKCQAASAWDYNGTQIDQAWGKDVPTDLWEN